MVLEESKEYPKSWNNSETQISYIDARFPPPAYKIQAKSCEK